MCEAINSDETELNEFNFTMPKCDVTIKVLYRWNDLNFAGKNNFLSFDSKNIYTTTSAI